MSYTITSRCIGCSRCQTHCPTGAVQKTGNTFWIDQSLCNNCAGTYSVPQCMAVCPTNDGCIPDVQEFWSRWFVKYNRLVSRLRTAEQAAYWEQWFDQYSQRIAAQLQAQQVKAETAL